MHTMTYVNFCHQDSLTYVLRVICAVKLRLTPFFGGSGEMMILTILAGSEEEPEASHL